jgi:hypothetical protein
MKSLAASLKSNKQQCLHGREVGFILPIIIITGILVGAGLMAMTARTFAGLFGSIRQGHNQEAREAAESGLAVLLRELNTNYPYLLTTSCAIEEGSNPPYCAAWRSQENGGDFRYETSVCPTTTTPPETLFSKLSGTLPGGRTRYRLLDYTFKGNIGQGGIGEFKVEGQSINSNNDQIIVRATTHLRQDTTIVPKGCRGAQGGYPGLLGETIDLGNVDVLGEINGNVVCLSCDPNQTQAQLEEDIGLKNRGVVEGQIFGGNISMPEPPSFPGFPSDYFDTYNIQPAITDASNLIDGNITLTAGTSNGGRCFTDGSNITHCLVSSISLSGGEKLIINTDIGGTPPPSMRIYVSGDLVTDGTSGLVHTGSPVDLAIFGLPYNSEAESCSQNLEISGTSAALSAFIFMPDACAGINGGGNANPNVYGSVWTRDYRRSLTNAGELVVPDDMGSLVCARFGINFCIGIREYAARGAQNWYLTPKQQQQIP